MENIIFGIRPVAEAIQSGRQIERLYIKKDAGGQLMTEFKDLCWRYRVRWQEVPVEKLNRMTRGNHQGVVAQIAAIGYVALQDILDRVPDDETPLIVVFDGVTDVRDENRNTIGLEGVRALFDRHAALAPEGRLRAIVTELRRLRLADDTTLMLIEDRQG